MIGKVVIVIAILFNVTSVHYAQLYVAGMVAYCEKYCEEDKL